MEKFVQSILQRMLVLPEDEDLLDTEDDEESGEGEREVDSHMQKVPGPLEPGVDPEGTGNPGRNRRPWHISFRQRHSVKVAKALARLHFYPSMVQLLAFERLFCAQSRRYYDRIDENVLLGAIPRDEEFGAMLVREEGIFGVVSLNENYELRHFSVDWDKLGVEFLQLPTRDLFEAPNQRNIRKGLEFIERTCAKGEESQDRRSVYVHCRAGRTRSASLVTCYLIKKHSWTPDEALDFLKTKHDHILIGPNQRKAIDKFYNGQNRRGLLQEYLIR